MKKLLICTLFLSITLSIISMETEVQNEHRSHPDEVEKIMFVFSIKGCSILPVDMHEVKAELALLSDEFKKATFIFHEKGWRLPEQITLSYTIPLHSTTHGLMSTNRKDTIEVKDRSPTYFTPDEIQYSFGHELAHMALPRHALLNPHAYMNILTSLTCVGTILIVTSWRASTLLMNKQYMRGIAVMLAGSAYAGNAGKIRSNRKSYMLEELKHNSFEEKEHYKYPILQKVEEIECDIISALTLPEGGKHGATFFERILALDGENIKNTTHPKHATRIKYLKAIQWLQEHGVLRHT